MPALLISLIALAQCQNYRLHQAKNCKTCEMDIILPKFEEQLAYKSLGNSQSLPSRSNPNDSIVLFTNIIDSEFTRFIPEVNFAKFQKEKFCLFGKSVSEIDSIMGGLEATTTVDRSGRLIKIYLVPVGQEYRQGFRNVTFLDSLDRARLEKDIVKARHDGFWLETYSIDFSFTNIGGGFIFTGTKIDSIFQAKCLGEK